MKNNHFDSRINNVGATCTNDFKYTKKTNKESKQREGGQDLPKLTRKHRQVQTMILTQTID